MIKTALVAPQSAADQVYGAGRREMIAARTDLLPGVIIPARLSEHLLALSDVEVIFSTWGCAL